MTATSCFAIKVMPFSSRCTTNCSKSGGRITKHPDQIGYGAEFSLSNVKELFSFSSCLSGIELIETMHILDRHLEMPFDTQATCQDSINDVTGSSEADCEKNVHFWWGYEISLNNELL